MATSPTAVNAKDSDPANRNLSHSMENVVIVTDRETNQWFTANRDDHEGGGGDPGNPISNHLEVQSTNSSYPKNSFIEGRFFSAHP